jgi:hypothetical protein
MTASRVELSCFPDDRTLTQSTPTERLEDQQMTPDAGDLAIDFTLRDSTGGERSLGSLVANGPCVLVFYRGHW